MQSRISCLVWIMFLISMGCSAVLVIIDGILQVLISSCAFLIYYLICSLTHHVGT